MLALGLRLLQWLRVAQDLGALEELLFAAGISFAILGVVIFAIGTVGWLRQGTAVILLVVAALVAGRGWLRLYELMTMIPGIGKKSGIREWQCY